MKIRNPFYIIFFSKWNRSFYVTFVFVFFLLIFHFLFYPISGSQEDLNDRANIYLKEQENKLYAQLSKKNGKEYLEEFYKTLQKKSFEEIYLTEALFEKRDNNLWLNFLFFKKFFIKNHSMRKYFDEEDYFQKILPVPQYPIVSYLFKWYYEYHIFPPANFMDIVKVIRTHLSSGLLIQSKPQLIYSSEKKSLSKEECLEQIKLLKSELNKIYKITFYRVTPNAQGLEKEHYIFNAFSFEDFKKSFFKKNRKASDLEEYYKFRIVYNKSDIKNLNILYTRLGFFNPDYAGHKISEFFIHEELIYSNSIFEWEDLFLNIYKKIKKNYTFHIEASYKNEDQKIEKLQLKKNSLYYSSVLEEYEKILSQPNYENLIINRFVIYESKILKYKIDSREFSNEDFLTSKIRNAFMLVEDGYFYFQFGGIDLLSLIKGTYEYIFYGYKKGYASINEQIYEIYLGKQNKNLFDKLVQILGALYLNYFTTCKVEMLDLYIQSIPGSFWAGNHTYGIKGILKSYLNKNSINNLTNYELAWISRIGLLPNLFGQNYARYVLYEQILERLNQQELNEENYEMFHDLRQKTKSNILKLKHSYLNVKNRISIAIEAFRKGNALINPIISEKEYQVLITSQNKISFYPHSAYINEYQSYTDQSLKDLEQFLGNWTLNTGLQIQVDFDEKAQKILEKQLLETSKSLGYLNEEKLKMQIEFHYAKDEIIDKDYGGAAVLLKTHHIKNRDIVNKIIAIASYHPKDKQFFNWAVEGKRNFGSIIKWLILALYLDEKNGTLLDKFYDIPRSYSYLIRKANRKNEEDIYGEYIPDNWKLNLDDVFGHYSYKLENNLVNFIRSKNNTFVKIADLIGLEKLSSFLNDLAELDTPENETIQYKPIYPIALGSHDINNVRFAQMNSVLANDGILQSIITLHSILIGTKWFSPKTENIKKQMLSKEAAQVALYAGYLNTYYGTATRFIKGAYGKTGSSDRDVSFLGMTGRSSDQTIEFQEAIQYVDSSSYLLNYNLLYLVNLGVNRGKIAKGLYGGNTAAYNAYQVFQELFSDYHFLVTGEKKKIPLSGNYKNYFSSYLRYEKLDDLDWRINGNKIEIPILIGVEPKILESYTSEELAKIQDKYIEYVENKMMEKVELLVEKEKEKEKEKDKDKGEFDNDNKSFLDFYEYKYEEQEKLEEQMFFLKKEKEAILFQKDRD